MDQKTVEALAVIDHLARQIKSLRENADDFCSMLSEENCSLVPGAGLATGKSLLRNTGEFYPVLGFDPSERSDLLRVMQNYIIRLDAILDGCSIKLSQGVKDLLAEGERFRNKMRIESEFKKTQGGKQ